MPDCRNRKRVNAKQQGRPRLNIKLTLRVAIAAFLLIATAVVLVWQLQRPEVLKADRQTTPPVQVSNPAYVTEMSLPQPVITHAAIQPDVIQFRSPVAGGGNQ